MNIKPKTVKNCIESNKIQNESIAKVLIDDHEVSSIILVDQFEVVNSEEGKAHHEEPEDLG